MAGPLTIQRFPTGLLGLLGTQASGDTPTLLNEQVAAIIDLLPFYSVNARVSFVGSEANLSGPGNSYFGGVGKAQAVQPGEMWLVHQFCVKTTTAVGAGMTGVFSPGITRGGTGPSAVITFGVSKSVVAGDLFNVGVYFDTPLVALPGDVFGVTIDQMTGAGPITTAYQLAGLYTRIPIGG